MFKSALLAIKPVADRLHHVDAAIQIAKRRGWSLTVCAVVDDDNLLPRESVPIGGGSFKAARDADALAKAHVVAAESLQQCAAKCATAGVPCETIVSEGHAPSIIAERAAACDLLFVGHRGGDDSGDASALWNLLKACPRPALIVPPQMQSHGDILLAYDGSFQAARTVASLAYSGLADGKTIHVLTCLPDEQQAAHVCGLACQFLEQHGLNALPIVEKKSGSPADEIVAQLERTKSRYLAMGAFGKPAVREFLLGSVTRSLLRKLPAPTLVNH
jgi:nucleotide-binding universal stress UspA family protein